MLEPRLQLALLGHRALHRPALHRAAAVDHGEAARLLDEHLDDRLGAAEVELAPPLLVGLDDRERADPVRADRDLRPCRWSARCGRSWLGLAAAGMRPTPEWTTSASAAPARNAILGHD